jgi:cobyrinic acid a,c-diamide synthase
MILPRLLIAGTHSGVGKTTVTLALLAAFRSQGRQVQPFKVGPDFIDPGHHQLASGRGSRNLDGWMLGAFLNRTTFHDAVQDADLSIIEGMMGLFDGSSPINEIGSSAEIAKQLNVPVLLVLDGSAMARSAAAMVFGYSSFDSDLRIAGVVFNRVNSEGHYRILRDAVEKETNVPAVGYFPTEPNLMISDRHLGLRTALEGKDSELYTRLGQAATRTLDLGRIEELARSSPEWVEPLESPGVKRVAPLGKSIRIGVAFDPAFCFYYPDNLELLEEARGELVRFSPMQDSIVPDSDVLYFGGGYPEIYADVLAENTAMLASIREFIRRGGIVYAECGGLMYLSRTLRGFDGKVCDMVGVIPGDVVMSRTHMTLGYRELTLTQSGLLGEKGIRIRGHEFHYSHLENAEDIEYIGRMTDARGKNCGGDGITVNNVVALYTHLHFASHPQVPVTLMQIARDQRKIRIPSHD